MSGLIEPLRTTDQQQADRCIKAVDARTIITEKFDTWKGVVTVTGEVQSVVDNKDANPRNWSVTFRNATTQ